MVVYLSGYIAGHFNSFVIHMSSKVPPSAVNFYPEVAKGYLIGLISGQCYGKNEIFANFYPDLGTGS